MKTNLVRPLLTKTTIGRSCLLGALVMLNATASAATFNFATDPFAGSDALITPGRQVVGGELFTNFLVASDVFAFDPTVFGIGNTINFANNVVGNLPTSGANVIVLQTFDNDANPMTAFGAGNAATLIADQITTAGAGFFLYFNSGLNVARLVFSPDLSDGNSDLKVVARLTNLTGQEGRDSFPTFTSTNFQVGTVPETASNLTLLMSAGALLAGHFSLRRRNARG